MALLYLITVNKLTESVALICNFNGIHTYHTMQVLSDACSYTHSHTKKESLKQKQNIFSAKKIKYAKVKLGAGRIASSTSEHNTNIETRK